MRCISYGDTHVGMKRTNNEDTFICMHLTDAPYVLCAAIDGMGGYEGGEVAAAITRDCVTSYVTSHAGKLPDIDVMKEAFCYANNEIVNRKQQDSVRSQMGCVATAALINLDECTVSMVHVGDSRMYKYDSAGLTKLSHDHSYVGYREEEGILTEEEAMHHPNRNLVDRSIGFDVHEPYDRNFIEASIFPVLSDTQYMFCSDGLTDLVTSAEIASVLQSKMALEEKVAELISFANQKGGKDNITVVIADVKTGVTEASDDTPSDQTAAEEDSQGDPETPENEDNEQVDDTKPLKVGLATWVYNHARMLVVMSMAVAALLSFVVGIVVGYKVSESSWNETVNTQEQHTDTIDWPTYKPVIYEQ